MRRASMLLLMLIGPIAGVSPAAAQGVDDDWDYKAVERTIGELKQYIWRSWRNGHWPETGTPGAKKGAGRTVNYGGTTALAAYALLTAGESYQSERMSRTLKWLAECPMHGTYARALRANVWASLGRDGPYRKALKADTDWLVKAVDARGAYNYFPGPRPIRYTEDPRRRPKEPFDNSNSQLAVLGAWAGARGGMEIPIRYWRRVESHWRSCQNTDGGWGYRDKGAKSYGSMSVAGLATMFICYDALYSRQFIRCKANTDFEPIVKGLRWIDRNFTAGSNPGKGNRWWEYYLYGVERVGLASGYKYFGKKDWYKAGAKALIGRRTWGGTANASFALLFLARGQNPVLFNKLKYPGTWNSRPRDLANLTRWITNTFEKPVNWQIIQLEVPVSEWHDAPILYVSGATAPRFTDDQIARLRTFVLQGGVIFSEAACNRAAFTLGMKAVYAKMFPEYELTRLADDHPIYNLHFNITRGRTLSGISNGIRLLAIHSPAEVSLAWQLNAPKTQAAQFQLGANVYFFVSDKQSLRKRGVSPWPTKRPFVPAETIAVQRVTHGANWNPEPLAWERFALLMGRRHRLKIELPRPVAFDELDAVKHPVAVVSGTAELHLTPKQKAALKKYLTGGGVMLLEASGGNAAFADGAEKLLEALLPDAKLVRVPYSHVIFKKVGPVIDQPRFRRALRKAVYDRKRPRLRGYYVDGRLAAIVSPDDLLAGLLGYQCWGLKGYESESALAIMRNVLLFAAGKTINGL